MMNKESHINHTFFSLKTPDWAPICGGRAEGGEEMKFMVVGAMLSDMCPRQSSSYCSRRGSSESHASAVGGSALRGGKTGRETRASSRARVGSSSFGKSRPLHDSTQDAGAREHDTDKPIRCDSCRCPRSSCNCAAPVSAVFTSAQRPSMRSAARTTSTEGGCRKNPRTPSALIRTSFDVMQWGKKGMGCGHAMRCFRPMPCGHAMGCSHPRRRCNPRCGGRSPWRGRRPWRGRAPWLGHNSWWPSQWRGRSLWGGRSIWHDRIRRCGCASSRHERHSLCVSTWHKLCQSLRMHAVLHIIVYQLQPA